MLATRRPTLFIAAALLAILVLAYLRPLFFGDTFALRDHVTLTVPARDHLATSLRSGEIPQWWDGVGLGVPFAANPMHGVTYPPAWLVAAFPLGVGADVVAILHLFVLGMGAAQLARRLGAEPMGAVVSGGALMCCGYTASMVANGIPLLTLAWTPWVAWAAEGVARRPSLRSGTGFSGLFAAQILSGDPAGVITSGLLALLWVAFRAERGWLAAAVVAAAGACAVLLAAVSVVPAIYLLAESERAGGIATADATVWSLHPLRMLEWLWPNALGDGADPAQSLARTLANTAADRHMDPAWSHSLFLGLPVFLLAAVAARRMTGRARWLLPASAAFVILALGTFTPAYQAYRFVVLPERLIRYPERHLVGALVVWTALAGVGFSAVFGPAPESRLWKIAAGAAAFLASGVAVAAFFAGPLQRLAGDGVDSAGAHDAMISGGLVAAMVLACVALALGLRHRKRYRALAPALAAAAIVGHLIGHGWSVQPLIARSAVATLPELLQPIASKAAREGPKPRIYRHRSMVPPAPGASRAELVVLLYHTAVANVATRFGFAYAPGYDPTASAASRQLWQAGARQGDRLLDLYDVAYRVARRPGSGDLAVVATPPGRPRAFVGHRWQEVPDTATLYRALFGPHFDRSRVLVEMPADRDRAGEPRAGAPASLTPCQIADYRATEVIVHCASEAPAFAVLLDAWAPGWQARVDGHAAPIYRADGLVRAVKIAPGRHAVHFEYHTPGLRLGALVSLLAWLNWGLIFYLARRRR